MPNGFSMITRRWPPFSSARPARPKLLDRRLVELRRRGQIVDARAVGAFSSSSRKRGQAIEIVGVADVARVVVDPLGELCSTAPGRNRCRQTWRSPRPVPSARRRA